MPQLFCIEYGFNAKHVAKHAKEAGWAVHGTSRRGGVAEDGTKLLKYTVGDASKEVLQAIGQADYVLISVPPALEGPRVYDDIHEIIKAHTKLVWFGYLSTTGVYGDHQGGWVDETTPLAPVEARSKMRVKDETEWQSLHRDFLTPVHLFRIAGIYGAGRNAIDQVRRRKAMRIEKEGQFFSRIHVEDLAGAIWKSMQQPMPGEIFNMADDLPTASHEPITYACELLDVMPPTMIPFEHARLSIMARSFYKASRKVKNDKLKQKLGHELAYPTYKEGLDAIKAEMDKK